LRVLALALVAAAFVALGLCAGDGGAAGCTANPIVCENQLTGVAASSWIPGNSGDPTIQGFSTEISVDHGQTIGFKVATPAAAYHLDIYRLGYYGGLGSRLVTTVQPSATLPQTQPPCLTISATGLIDCGNWALSASWNVPAGAVSGLYAARLDRNDTGGGSVIFFVVRDDERRAPVLFQTSDATWEAYNAYGGNSLYVGNPAGRAYAVSYNRPLTVRNNSIRNSPLYSEWPMLQWLERNGYDVSYSTDVDTARAGAQLLEHEVFLSVGHDEYWSADQRANVSAARDAGVGLAFFSGNEGYWKTRFAASIDSSATPWRTIVSYKESTPGVTPPIDPADPPVSTGTWRDPRFGSADAGKPENALSGTIFEVDAVRDDAITVPAADAALRFWRDTSIADLQPGQTATLPQGTLGYEWDSDQDNGARPAGVIDMSSTTLAVASSVLADPAGTNATAGTVTHSLTLYRAASGALVFGAGTVQWSFGLNANHDGASGTSSPAPDARMQQATVNLLADMSVQPATVQSGLVAASASTDTTPPTTTVTSPAPSSLVVSGKAITIAGTAADIGGTVAGVEVSTDSGQTWHPATGTTSWSYVWTPTGSGQRTIVARATDDSANIGNPSPGVTVSFGQCPCSIWGGSSTPANPSVNDSAAYELGVRFKSDANGFLTGIRFYKGAGNGGTHVGHLWTNTGTLLGSATFTGETATGWQEADFASPIAVAAGTVYVASYTDPQGHYAADRPFFATAGVDSPPLHALAAGVSGPNGVYAAGGGFPNQSYQSSNYWVDVVLDASPADMNPPTVQAVTPAAGATGVATSQVTVTFSEAMAPGSLTTSSFFLKNPTGAIVPATVGYDAPSLTATVTATSPLAASTVYTATVKSGGGGVTDAAGNALANDFRWTFTTAAAAACPCTIWSPSATPAVISVADSSPYELGVKFRSDQNGFVTGIRFYKGAGNTGTHVGHLWSATGAQLGAATFGGETTSGWQQVSFAQPIAVAANTTYVASYFAPNGGYAQDRGYFASGGVDRAPLHALAAGVDGANGVYAGGGGFPAETFQSSSYWVDVVFSTSATDSGPPTVTDTTPLAGATGVAASTVVRARFSEPMAAASANGSTVLLKDASGSLVTATVAYDGASTSATLTPNAPLAGGTTYTATVKGGSAGVTDAAGNALAADDTWSFTTGAATSCPCSLWAPSATPGTTAVADTQAYELGVRFTSDVDGLVNGIRFYKGAGNGGTHLGDLWTAAGTLLGTVTFTGETASGWQEADFATPIAVTAGVVYVASYLDPQGHFAVDRNMFSAAGVDSPPLHAPAAGASPNGVYTPDGGFPTQSYQSSNYWVDVVFATARGGDTTPPTVRTTTPAPGATGVGGSTSVRASFSEALAPASIGSATMSLAAPGGALVAASVAYDQSTASATLSPTAALAPSTTYTATVRGGHGGVTDVAGNPLAADYGWSFTTGASTTCPCSIWSSSAAPTNPSLNDGGAYELGVRFTSDLNGFVAGIRFYKGVGNGGTHVGHLWTNTGTPLGTVTFTGETASGWQEADFASPIPVAAGTVYAASYSDPQGHYAADRPFFSLGAVDNPPLHALATDPDGANGVYANDGGFPTQSYQSTNYWVDVVFGT
jgi:hypothetical protein